MSPEPSRNTKNAVKQYCESRACLSEATLSAIPLLGSTSHTQRLVHMHPTKHFLSQTLPKILRFSVQFMSKTSCELQICVPQAVHADHTSVQQNIRGSYVDKVYRLQHRKCSNCILALNEIFRLRKPEELIYDAKSSLYCSM